MSNCFEEIEIVKLLPLNIKKVTTYTVNFKCPNCNEGSSYHKKTRAYYICKPNGGYIYCHNCGYHKKLFYFIKEFFPDYIEDFNNIVRDLKFQKFLHPEKFELEDKNILINKDIPKFDPIFNNRNAVQYVESRGISIEVYRTWYSDSSSVIIPLLNERSSMFGYQHRYFVKNSKLKYITELLDHSYKKLYSFYDIKYKLSDKVYICEGIFDSATLQSIGLNSISVLGASIPNEVLNVTDNVVILLDNDERGIKEMKKLAERNSDLKFILLPNIDGKKMDVNSFYLNYGKEKLLQYLEDNEKSSLSILFDI